MAVHTKKRKADGLAGKDSLLDTLRKRRQALEGYEANPMDDSPAPIINADTRRGYTKEKY